MRSKYRTATFRVPRYGRVKCGISSLREGDPILYLFPHHHATHQSGWDANASREAEDSNNSRIIGRTFTQRLSRTVIMFGCSAMLTENIPLFEAQFHLRHSGFTEIPIRCCDSTPQPIQWSLHVFMAASPRMASAVLGY